MGSESHGKVRGLGRGVTAIDMHNMRHQAESPLIMKLMKKNAKPQESSRCAQC